MFEGLRYEIWGLGLLFLNHALCFNHTRRSNAVQLQGAYHGGNVHTVQPIAVAHTQPYAITPAMLNAVVDCCHPYWRNHGLFWRERRDGIDVRASCVTRHASHVTRHRRRHSCILQPSGSN